MESTVTETIVTVLAVVLTLGLVPLGLYIDHRKRKMVFDERRLMIERGMTPPATMPETNPLAFLHEIGTRGTRDPRAALDACLRRGTVLVFLGLGLWLGDVVLNQRLTALAEYGSRGAVALVASGTFAAAGAVFGLTGVGNLLYYALARRPRDVQ